MVKKSKLFRSGGSYAVRIPKSWAPPSGQVVLRREGNRIIITEDGGDVRDLARQFAADGLIDWERPSQPTTPDIQPW